MVRAILIAIALAAMLGCTLALITSDEPIEVDGTGGNSHVLHGL